MEPKFPHGGFRLGEADGEKPSGFFEGEGKGLETQLDSEEDLAGGGPSRGRAVLFLLAEGAIYASFLWLDWFGRGGDALSSALKYAGILGCVLYVLLEGGHARFPRKCRILRAAAIFVGCADLFLLFTDHYACGVALFLAAQLCYSHYLMGERGKGGKERAGTLAVLAVSCGAVLLALSLFGIEADGLLALSVFYFLQFFQNVCTSFSLPYRPHRMFRWGICLFFLCDIHVAIYNSGSYGIAWAGWLIRMAGAAMWLYYLPGQALLALSAVWER